MLRQLKNPAVGLASLSSLLCCALPAEAQVRPTAGAGDVGTLVSGTTDFTVTGGSQRLNTLFHSFEDFSPETANVLFQLDASQSGIEHVIGRVTGDNASFIDAQLALTTTGNSPDLFLINPNGITFGANASLSLPGSFVASTAESVLFEDGLEFGVSNSGGNAGGALLLSVSAPIGLQMGPQAAGIEVNNVGHSLSAPAFPRYAALVGSQPTGLQVDDSHLLALVGGNVALRGGVLSVAEGQVALGAVASPDVVTFSSSDSSPNWQVSYDNVSEFGDILLTQQSLIDAGDVGSVALRGQHISLQDGSIVVQENNTSQVAGSLQLQATDTLSMLGSSSDGLSSGILSDTRSDGRGGDIVLTAGQVLGQDGGLDIRSFTFGRGTGGDVTINAEQIELLGNDAGNPLIEVRTLGEGNGGDVTIQTGRLTLQESAIVNNVNNGTGNAGTIVLNAAEQITLGPNNTQATLIGSSSVGALGNAGEIMITTPNLTVQGGALISSSTFGAGNAGKITVNADQLTVTGEGFNSIRQVIEPSRIRTAGVLLPRQFRPFFRLPDAVTGSSGDILLNVDVLSVTDQGEVSVSHDDVGDGGSLQINGRQVFLRDGGSLLAFTQAGNGGNIQLDLEDLLFMRENGLIDTESLGIGNGGNVTISAPVIAGFENSDIVASAVGGNGGNIAITTQSLVGLAFQDQLTAESDITASSQLGLNGTVEINNLTVNPAAALVELPSAPAEADDQVATACASTGSSQFIASGRGGLPVAPTTALVENHPWGDVRGLSEVGSGVPDATIASTHDSTAVHSLPKAVEVEDSALALVEASGWQVDGGGNVELVTAIASIPSSIHVANCLAQVRA